LKINVDERSEINWKSFSLPTQVFCAKFEPSPLGERNEEVVEPLGERRPDIDYWGTGKP